MSDPVMVDKAVLDKAAKERDQAVEGQVRMVKEIKVLSAERDKALDAVNRSNVEIGQLRKVLPSDKVQAELKGLRTSMGEAHKQISVLEKALAAAQAEAEARRKEVAQTLRRFENVQGTFDTLQIARDKAYSEREKLIADIQKGAEAYQKLLAEFDAFKKATAEAKQPQRAAKVPEPAKA